MGNFAASMMTPIEEIPPDEHTQRRIYSDIG
jgi:hypothetical protein